MQKKKTQNLQYSATSLHDVVCLFEQVWLNFQCWFLVLLCAYYLVQGLSKVGLMKDWAFSTQNSVKKKTVTLMTPQDRFALCFSTVTQKGLPQKQHFLTKSKV